MKTSNTFLLILILFVIVSSQQLVLLRYSGPKTEDKLVHTIPITINDQTFKLRVDLNEQKSWIKSNKCTACVNLQCKESCSSKLGPAKQGLKCSSPSCTLSSNNYNQNNIEGTQAEVEVKIGKNFEKSINLVVIDKVKLNLDNYTHQYDGVLNILEEPEIFDDFTLNYQDKKLYLGVNQQFDTKHSDPKDNPFNETLQTDGGIQVQSIEIGSTSLSADNKAYIDLNTKSFHLPQEEFKKFQQKIEEINKQCSLQSGLLKCSGSSEINKIKQLIVGISFGANKIQLPFSVFVDSCKSKECQVLIKQSEEDKIIFGEVIFFAFGIHVQTSDRTITFHRLKNSFSTKFHELAGVRTSQPSTQSSGSFFSYFGSFFLFFFKIIIVLAILALCINLYYNKTHVTRWIRAKTQGQDSGYSPAFSQDIENAGVLHGYDPKNATKQFWQQNTVDGI